MKSAPLSNIVHPHAGPHPFCCSVRALKLNHATGGMLSVEGNSKTTPQEITTISNPFCLDIGEMSPYNAILDEALRQEWDKLTPAGQCPNGCPSGYHYCKAGVCTQPKCQDIVRYCNEDSFVGNQARMLCPISCGCDKPIFSNGSALLAHNPLYGCPSYCSEVSAFQQTLDTSPCMDVPSDYFRQPKIVAGFESLTKNWPPYFKAQVGQVLPFLQQHGCDYGRVINAEHRVGLTTLYPANVSKDWMCGFKDDRDIGLWGMPALTNLYTVCPVTCGCTQSGGYIEGKCPSSCKSRRI